MNDTERAALVEAMHLKVADVFLDCPEGIDSQMLANNVMRDIDPIIDRLLAERDIDAMLNAVHPEADIKFARPEGDGYSAMVAWPVVLNTDGTWHHEWFVGTGPTRTAAIADACRKAWEVNS